MNGASDRCTIHKLTIRLQQPSDGWMGGWVDGCSYWSACGRIVGGLDEYTCSFAFNSLWTVKRVGQVRLSNERQNVAPSGIKLSLLTSVPSLLRSYWPTVLLLPIHFTSSFNVSYDTKFLFPVDFVFFPSFSSVSVTGFVRLTAPAVTHSINSQAVTHSIISFICP